MKSRKEIIDVAYNVAYMLFVLGYDLLHDYFAESEEPECDIVFEKCAEIYDKFLDSEYNRVDKSEYECLAKFVNDCIK